MCSRLMERTSAQFEQLTVVITVLPLCGRIFFFFFNAPQLRAVCTSKPDFVIVYCSQKTMVIRQSFCSISHPMTVCRINCRPDCEGTSEVYCGTFLLQDVVARIFVVRPQLLTSILSDETTAASLNVPRDVISCRCGFLGSMTSMCTQLRTGAGTAGQRVSPAGRAPDLHGGVAIGL